MAPQNPSTPALNLFLQPGIRKHRYIKVPEAEVCKGTRVGMGTYSWLAHLYVFNVTYVRFSIGNIVLL